MALAIDSAKVASLLRRPDGAVARALERKAAQVELLAKRFSPVDTGRLRASITHYLTEDSEGLVAYVGSNVSYTAYQEYGTSRMPASPFLRPALVGARDGATLNAIYEASTA